MKTTISITLDSDIMLSKELYDLRISRRLSSLINDFLRQHLNIKPTESILKLKELEREKEQIELSISKLKIEKAEEERKKSIEASKWHVVETSEPLEWDIHAIRERLKRDKEEKENKQKEVIE